MLFDTHTNLMWYPDHLSDEFVEFAWEAKRAKMKLSPDVYFAGGDTQQANAFDSKPEQLLKATAEADKVIVFGIDRPCVYPACPEPEPGLPRDAPRRSCCGSKPRG